MGALIKNFFQGFLKKNRKQIFWSSFWRFVACLQTLFWPFAFAKIVNIVSADLADWKRAIPWILALIINKALEDFIRLRSKYRLQKIIIKLKTALACFFTQETELRDGARTGEAVQDVKKVTEVTETLASYYKDSFLQLPVNLVLIPIILFKTEVKYFLFIIAYTLLYLVVDYFWAAIYAEAQEGSVKAGEELWGATYRKAPDVWREREDGQSYRDLISRKADDYFNRETETQNIHHWRWVSIQILSSLFRGAIIIFVLFRIIKKGAPVGDLILLDSYFSQTQSSLNILSTTVKYLIDWRAALGELGEALKEKTTLL